jgi:Secretion system C-terminal sorting domain
MKKVYFLIAVLVAGGTSFAQTFPNAGMETWRSNTAGTAPVISVHAPTEWYGFDSLAIASVQSFAFILHPGSNFHAQLYQENTIINSGAASAKVMTMVQDTIGIVPGSLSNAVARINFPVLIGGGTLASATTFSGGTQVTSRITSVSAYVRYTAGIDSATGLWGGKDTAMLTVQARGHKHGGNDTLVGNAALQILPSTSFSQVTAYLVYWDSVDYSIDTVRVIFSSSGGGRSKACDSSTLYVDDVSMTGVANPDFTGVKNVVNNNAVSVFPNPATSVLNISCLQSAATTFELYSVTGQMVAQKYLSGNDKLDVSDLSSGLYIYTVRDNQSAIIQSGKVALNR